MIFELLIVLSVVFRNFCNLFLLPRYNKDNDRIEQRFFLRCFREASSAEEVSKRDFLIEKVKNGKSISNFKTSWTEERLQKASDKVINKLYEKYQNPPPIRINKQEALELGKPHIPVLIEMYPEGLENLMGLIPYVGSKYTINIEKLETKLSAKSNFAIT